MSEWETKTILTLTIQIVEITFNANERKIYDSMEEKARNAYMRLKRLGGKVVNSNVLFIKSKMHPIRSVCSGGKIPEATNSHRNNLDDYLANPDNEPAGAAAAKKAPKPPAN